MKNILSKILCLLIVFSAFNLVSCVKSRPGETDFSGLQPIVQIAEGGLLNFSGASLSLNPGNTHDTVYFHINYAAKQPAASDVVVTTVVDAAAVTKYNNDPANNVQFTQMPSSYYSFPLKDTVKAGQNYVEVPVVFNSSTIDFTKNWMLAITIKDASGNTISGNFPTIYYHIIGNPLAGVYSWDFTRYNSGVFVPSLSFTGHSTIFIPDDATTIEVGSNYANGYVLSFTNTNGVLSNFQVSFSAATLQSLASSGVTVTSGPTIVTADPVTKTFQFTYSVLNPSGAPRTFIDKFYK